MKIPAGLKKKVGPLPLGAWLVLGTAGGGLVYKKFSKGSSTTPSATGQNYYDAAGNLYDASGNLLAAAPTGGSAGDAGQPVISGGSSGAIDGGSTPTQPLGNADLLSAIDTAYNSGAGAYGSGVESGASLATTAFDTGATDISGPFGDVITSLIDSHGQASPAVAKSTKTVAKKPSFFTFKKDVKLKAGETLGFSPGHGYYAKNSATPPIIPVPEPSAGGTAHKLTARRTAVRPNVLTTNTGTHAQKASPKPATDTRTYHTFKNKVPLGHGQTVHFTPGKGYYAA